MKSQSPRYSPGLGGVWLQMTGALCNSNEIIKLTLPHVSAYSLYQRNKNLHFSYIFLVYRNMFTDYDVIVSKHVTVDEKDVRKV